MATNKSVKPTPAGKYPLGNAKEAKDASTWSYKFPESTGTARDIGVYPQPKPNTMSADIGYKTDPTRQVAGDFKPGKPAARVSLGDPNRQDIKTDGVNQRGFGAATKGYKSRGPLA